MVPHCSRRLELFDLSLGFSSHGFVVLTKPDAFVEVLKGSFTISPGCLSFSSFQIQARSIGTISDDFVVVINCLFEITKLEGKVCLHEIAGSILRLQFPAVVAFLGVCHFRIVILSVVIGLFWILKRTSGNCLYFRGFAQIERLKAFCQGYILKFQAVGTRYSQSNRSERLGPMPKYF